MANRKLASAATKLPKGLDNGLRNYWYPILESKKLSSDKPMGIRRLGEDLVLWRDKSGKPSLFVDICAHRAAPLSLGLIDVKGRLECWYHGLAYDGEGQCRNVPFERKEDGPLAKHYQVKSYPCEESHGFIWGYIGDVEMFPPPPLTMEPEVAGPDYQAMPYCEPVWDAAWPLELDNVTDPAHAAFLHRTTAAAFVPPEDLFEYFVPEEVTIEIIEGDLRVGGSRGKGLQQVSHRKVGGNDVEFYYLPALVKVIVPLPVGGEPMLVLGYITPIDESHMLLFEHLCRKVHNEKERQEWKEIWPRVSPLNAAVNAQDRQMVEAQKNVVHARSGERLIPTDAGVVAARQLTLEAFQAQRDIIAKSNNKGKAKAGSR